MIMTIHKSHLWLLTVSLYTLLCAVVLIDILQMDKNQGLVLFLQLAPLALLLPGLIGKHYRSFSWLCFLMLLYFSSYVVQVYAASRSTLDMAGLLLSILIFIAAMFTSRRLQRDD